MKYSNQTTASLPRLAMFFLLAFTKAAPRQGDKGRQRSGRLRSSSPLVIRGRAGTIEKQKNELPRPLWTACGRSELRKKLEPSCLTTTLAAVSRVALGTEREARRQRKSGLKPARSDTERKLAITRLVCFFCYRFHINNSSVPSPL